MLRFTRLDTARANLGGVQEKSSANRGIETRGIFIGESNQHSAIGSPKQNLFSHELTRIDTNWCFFQSFRMQGFLTVSLREFSCSENMVRWILGEAMLTEEID